MDTKGVCNDVHILFMTRKETFSSQLKNPFGLFLTTEPSLPTANYSLKQLEFFKYITSCK
jgi:hypothetical protein